MSGYYHDTTFIKKKILENYNTDAVPVFDTNVSLAINVSIYIMALQGLNEINQILSTSVYWHFCRFERQMEKLKGQQRMT
jgi:hypothetical protein